MNQINFVNENKTTLQTMRTFYHVKLMGLVKTFWRKYVYVIYIVCTQACVTMWQREVIEIWRNEFDASMPRGGLPKAARSYVAIYVTFYRDVPLYLYRLHIRLQ